MNNQPTKLKSTADTDGWELLTQRAKTEENVKQSWKRPGKNSPKGASYQRHERNRNQSSADWPEPTFWKYERSTRIQPRPSYRRRESYSPERKRSTGSYNQSPYHREKSYTPENKPSKGKYHQSPYQKQKSYSPENKPSKGNYHGSSYQRQKSLSPKIKQTPRNYRQSSDRRRKSYSVSIEMEENERDLIWLVGKCAYLWDQKNPSYRDHKKRKTTWTFISDVLGMDENECKEHWKYLRRRYTREIIKLPGRTAPDFKHLMDTELLFLKPLYQDVRIVENSESSDVERWESILKKSPNPKAFMAWIRLSISTQNQSDTRSSVSRNEGPPKMTSRTSPAAPHSVRPSSSSLNQRSAGTASSPFLQTPASTASLSSNKIGEAVSDGGKELEYLFSDIDSSGDEEDYSALDAPMEQSDDELGANPSPMFDVRPASERNKKNEKNLLAEAIAANIEQFSPHVKHLILSEIHRVDPNYSQDKL